MKWTILGISLLFFVAACAQTGDDVKIGVIAPLTGDLAVIGENAVVAAQMAVDEINAAGGVNGKTVNLIVEDGHCNGKEAVAAGNKLINVDGVRYIMGGMCSSETLAVAPISEQNKVVMLSPCSSAPAVSDAGDFIFRNYPSDSFVGSFAAEYMHDVYGAKRVAILACMNDYCTGIKEAFENAFESYDGTKITGVERFESTTRDIRSQITKLKDSDAEAVLFLAYTEAAIAGFKQMEELGLDVPIFGTDTFDDPTILEGAGTAGEGMRYAIPYTLEGPAFVGEFKERSGGEDITACTPQAYDAIHILARTIAQSNTSSEVRDMLYSMQPYAGASGTISFDENGDLDEAAYLVKEYRDGAQVPVHTFTNGEISAVE